MRQCFILYALRIAILLGFLMNVAINARADQLIGLLTLPGILGREGILDREEHDPEEVVIYESPSTYKRIGSIRVVGYNAREAGRARVYLNSGDESDFPILEYGYETPAAVVLEQRGRWFKVRLNDGAGWIQSSERNKFLPLEELLEGRMIYLTVYFNGQLSPVPSSTTLASDVEAVKPGSFNIGARHMPRPPGEPIGLLMLPEIFFTSKCDGFQPGEEIAMYADPNTAKRIGSIRCLIGHPQVYITYDEFDYGTTQLPTLSTARQSTGSQSVIGIPVQELEYETKAAIVLEKRDQWLKIDLGYSFGTGWIQSSERNKFFPLETLLPDDRLKDLLDIAPGADIPAHYDVVDSRPVRILDSKRVDGRLWFNVEILSHSIYDNSKEDPTVIGKGWLPAHNATGHPTIWFYSRGL